MQVYYNIKQKIIKRAFAYIIIIFFIFLSVILFIDKNIRPAVISMSEAKVKSITLNAINNAIIDTMGYNLKYSDLITVVKDKEGKIVALEANTIRMNMLASEIALIAYNNINKIGSQGVFIPIGSIVGGELLAGQGPLIYVKIVPASSVRTDFVTEFQTAGINQTRHKIFLKVTTQIKIVAPTGSEKLEVATQIPIAETVIVGDVPNNFVNVDETSKMLNLIPRD